MIEKRRILVTAISGDVANGILKVLSKCDDETYGCDINDYPVGMDKVKVYWKSLLAVHEDYVSDMLEKCHEHNITHLIPVNEKEIEVVSKNINLFKDNGIKVVINSEDILERFLDKKLTFDKLSDIEGISVPKTMIPSEFKEDGKKYIVKPRKSCGSKDIRIITSKYELKDVETQGQIVQEYIGNNNDEYTVGVFSNGNTIDTIIFKRKLQYGYTSFVELVEDESIVEDAKRIAESINLKGYINLQLRKKENKNYIFEINPRISGTVYFRDMLGFRDVVWWLDLLDEKDEHVYKQEYKKAIGMRELREKYVVLEK